MENQEYEAILYLLDHLADVNELNLPASEDDKSVVPACIEIRLSSDEVKAIETIARGKELNVLKLFLAGLGILLWKYTSQDKILISIPPLTLGDTNPDEYGVLYCKLEPGKETQVDSFLAMVHESLNAAYLNGKYNDKNFKEQFAAGNNNISILREIGFSYNKLNAAGTWLNEHALVFELEEKNSTAVIRINSRSTLFPEKMLRNMGESLLSIVLRLSENKHKPLSSLSIVTTEDQHSWENQFSENTRSYPKEFTVIDLFIRSVNTNPQKTALFYGDKRISYKELNEHSERIASVVHSFSTGKNPIVGLMIERSSLLVAAVIGILRSGSAYLPFDKQYPAERIREISEDSGCTVILTDSAEHPQIEGCRFINISDAIAVAPAEENTLPEPHDLAYVIYSSGTTGKPKGIMVEHAAIMNLLYFYNERYGITENTRIVQLTNIVIDIAFQEIFSALINGLTLYIPLTEESRDKDRFINYLEEHRVNFIQLIPDMLSEYLLDTPKLKYLDLVLCGGDKLSDHLKDAIVEKGYTLFNVYGQTETAIDTVGALCKVGVPSRFNEYVPNYEVLILDEYGNLCPEYITGEIHTSGEGLARGYLNKPQLTNEKFIPHPFKKNQLIYRTGDLGRRFPDGSIGVLGRKDDQIKIRGYRIELSEIENALEAHPEIDGAVVTVAGQNEEKELVAYIVGKTALNIASIRSYLGGIKPSYMLPGHFIQLHKFPLNTGGKVDRKKLPAPDGLSMETGTAYVAPSNETERKIAEIWQTLLSKQRVGIRDNFFELGGDSIKILRLMSELKKQLNMKMSFADLYKYNTIEGLLEHISLNKNEIDKKARNREKDKEDLSEEFDKMKQRILSAMSFSEKENVEDIYPMSDIEKGIVYESLINEGSGIYHDIAVHRRVFADFDRERFGVALELLTEKHSILRTGFNLEDYETQVQIVYKKIVKDFGYEQISELNSEEQKNAINTFIKQALLQPFVFSIAPLWRISVFDVGNQEICFVTQAHHSIMDGWSDASFMTELNNLYLKLGEDVAFVPVKLKSTYRDFVIEQELDKKDISVKQFWKKELADHSHLTIFTEEDCNDVYYKAIDPHLLKRAEQLATDLNTSLKVVSLSAYLYLLNILNYENEITAGLVTNTRPDCEDSDKLLGCFLNTIPMKMVVDGNSTRAGFITTIHQKLSALKKYERLSMLEISALHDSKQRSGNPFFDVIFNYIDFHAYNLLENHTVLESTANTGNSGMSGNGQTNTFFDFDFDKTGSNCFISLRLSKKLKSGFSAEYLSFLFLSVIEQIVDLPDLKLKEIKYTGEKEQENIIASFNALKATSQGDTIVSMFESQVLKTPSSIALVFENNLLSYQSLNERSNRLAAYLRKNYKIQRDELVGILLDRSEWTVIALLGVLKSGAAYVPLDPDYPQERIDYMRTDSNCLLVIDESELKKFREEEEGYSAENLAPIHSSENLAYVIYTSGSTGAPKGVMVEHRNVVSIAKGWRSEYNLEAMQVNLLQVASISFDVFMGDVCRSLLVGGKMIVCPLSVKLDPENLYQLMKLHEISVIEGTPGILLPLMNYVLEMNTEIDFLKLLIFGSDTLSNSAYSELQKKLGDKLRIINSYGTTETAIDSTWFEGKGGVLSKGVTPIGKPFPNSVIIIVNADGQLLPAGLEGEICIGGLGVARGYLNRKELTSDKFIENSFIPGERIYRTGDTGRWLQDGNIEFTGRKDDQVKIRGYRIELGEIENALLGYDKIDTAAVLVKSHEDGENYLVAYVTGKEELNVSEIRSFLMNFLPDHMIPFNFVQPDQMPLTPNGKVDKKMLLKMEAKILSLSKEYIAPANEIEKQLTVVWQQILGKEKIGVTDNFFEAGGHSLKVVMVLSRINKLFNVKVDVNIIFKDPTIRSLAKYIEAVSSVEHEAAAMGDELIF
jgi:amino acid adenylation domain-containing protein